MPYVALARADRDQRLATANARWQAILETRPDLAPAVALQRQLIGLVVDLADAIERSRLPRLSLPPKYLAAKLRRGVPALAGEPVPLPISLMRPALLRLCEELSAGGAGEAADNIRSALDENRLDAGSLLTASLARDQKAIRTGAVHRGLAADLVWLVAELAVSPYAHALEQMLLAPSAASADDGSLGGALAAWAHGYCPACGSWPALVEIAEDRRVLRCSFCALAWELAGPSCIYCGKRADALTPALPFGARADRGVEICHGCRAYLKTVRVESFSPFPLLAIADLETMDLDLAAMEGGYGRPPILEFQHKSL